MKKVILALAVSAVFVACDSKKKDPEPTTPAGTDTTNKMVTPPAGKDTNKTVTPPPAAGDTGKSKMDHAKDAMNKGGAAVSDAKNGNMQGAAENGKGAVDAAKKAVGH